MSRKILESREVFPQPWIILDRGTRKELSVRVQRVLEARPNGVRINVVAAWGDGYEYLGDAPGDLYVAKYSALFTDKESVICLRGISDDHGQEVIATFEELRARGIHDWSDRGLFNFAGSSTVHTSLEDVHAIRISYLEPTVLVTMFTWKRSLAPSVEDMKDLVCKGWSLPQDGLGFSSLYTRSSS